MTVQEKIYKDHSTSKEFLVSKTSTSDSSLKNITSDNCLLKELKDEFNIESGDIFNSSVLSKLPKYSQFCAMVFKLDKFEDINENFFVEKSVVKAIEKITSGRENQKGCLENDIFVCFLPDLTESEAFTIAEKIQNEISSNHNFTISIGLAFYPELSYKIEDISINGQKAIDHASFFGPGSIVKFDAISLNISGDKLYQSGKYKEAGQEFETGLKLDYSNINLHNSLGVCYGILEKYDKALKEFDTVIKFEPDEIMALYNSGMIYSLAGNNEKALDFFIQAHEKNVEIFETAFQTGRLYFELGKPVEGIRYLLIALKLNSRSWLTAYYLGECYFLCEDEKKAIKFYTKAVKINPKESSSISMLGFLFDKRNENSEIALTYYKHSIELSPGNGLFRKRLALFYLKNNQQKEALYEFEKAQESGEDTSEYLEEISEGITIV